MRKDDWNDAASAWIAAERERLGGPPTAEEVVACQRGELPVDEAARVRALLVYYPELTSLLIESDPEPVDDELSEFELARDRAAIHRRIAAKPRFQFRVLMEVAAGVTIALLGGLLIHARTENREPYLQARHELRNVLTRGGGSDVPFDLPASSDRYLLALTLAKHYDYAAYRIDIVDLTPSGPKTLRSISGATPVDGTFELSVPPELLASGSSRIDVNGVDNGRAHLLESFPIRVANR
jgi:hypothetical protein